MIKTKQKLLKKTILLMILLKTHKTWLLIISSLHFSDEKKLKTNKLTSVQ